MAKNKSKLIFQTTDFLGNLVALPRDRWENHIIEPTDGHPDMDGYEEVVKDLLGDPYEVCLSTYHDSALVYISEPGVGPSADGVRAIVVYDGTDYIKGATKGEITTAYGVDWTRYPRPRIGKTIHKRKV